MQTNNATNLEFTEAQKTALLAVLAGVGNAYMCEESNIDISEETAEEFAALCTLIKNKLLKERNGEEGKQTPEELFQWINASLLNYLNT